MSNEKLFSIQTGKITHFTEVDYVLFGLLLVISAGIGLFFAIKDRKHNNTKTFLMAGGEMSPFPVALSLLASFMSAITILGTPAEMYNYTTMYYWIGLSYLFVAFGAAHVFMPIFYQLRVRSAYEVISVFIHHSFFHFQKLCTSSLHLSYICRLSVPSSIINSRSSGISRTVN